MMRTIPRRIGLSIDTVGSYGREVIRGIMDYCQRNPHWTITVEPRSWLFAPQKEPDTLDVDGLIVQAHSRAIFEKLERVKFPVVNVANMLPGEYAIPTVIPDDAAIGAMAADYFMSIGFRHFAFAHNSGYGFAQVRGQAFQSQLATKGHKLIMLDAAQGELRAMLPKLPTPTAIFCCNDAWAHHMLAAAHACKLRVPDDLSVLGVDDDELLNMLGAKPVSSIAIPASKIGFHAATLLNRAIGGATIPAMTTLPPLSVVARATTDITALDDSDLRAALSYIKDNVFQPLQVSDVVQHIATSRRSLERRFKLHLGHSIATQIRQAHVGRAKQLLVATTMPIEDVAKASGFSSLTMLGVVFRREVGESPTAYRLRCR